MGIDTLILIKEKDLKDLIEDFETFYFLAQISHWRWYHFEQVFELDQETPITSKELLKQIASLNKQIKNKHIWIDILDTYDLIFQPDTKPIPKGRISISEAYYKATRILLDNIKQLITAIKQEL